MVANVQVQAGVCGFRTDARVVSPDDQQVTFEIESDCAKIGGLAEALAAVGPVDAFAEIGRHDTGVLMGTVQQHLTGCCAGCAVPVGLFKAMQVAAGVALPRDIAISLSKET